MKTLSKILLGLSLPLICFAQVSLNMFEIPFDWGIESTYWSESDTINGVTINLGSPGGGNNWNYTNLDSTNQFSQTIVDGDETPYAAQFTDANLVLETDDLTQFGIPGPGYIFFKLTTTALQLKGLGVEYGGQPFPIVLTNPITWVELPLDYGDDWVNGFFYQFFFDSLGQTYRLDIDVSFDAQADAYGNLNIPQGNCPALRVRNDIDISITLYWMLFGIPIQIYADEMNYISYFWMAENLNMSALVMSQEGETNPNFTTAASFSVLADITTGFLTAGCAPVNPPVQIPPAGGSFAFNINLQNNTTEPQTFDAWLGVYLPTGQFFGPLLLRNNMTLPANGSLFRAMNQTVPASAPAGTYYYVTALGDYDQAEVQSWDGFSFVKLGTDDYGIASAGWEVYGFDSPLAISENTPGKCELLPAYPNPFNAETKISFTLAEDGFVSLKIFDIKGREIAVLNDGLSPAGDYDLTFNAGDLTSGVYFAVLQAEGLKEIQKLILVK
jgi:hypothetical protein